MVKKSLWATINSMEKQALKISLIVLGVLALGMIFYYKVFRAHTDDEISLNQKVEISREVKSEFEGIYSPVDSLEGAGKRISFLSITRKEDGSLTGSWRMEKIGGDEIRYFDCLEARADEKEFFVKCVNSEYGTISYDGEMKKAEAGYIVSGKLMWMNQGTVLLEKSIQMNHAFSY